MKKKEDIGLRILKAMKRKQFYRNTNVSKSLLANGLAHCPNFSAEATGILIPCVLDSFFSQVGIPYDPKDLANISPSASCLKEMICEEAFYCYLDVRCKVTNTEYVNIATDKGKKKGLNHFVQILMCGGTGKK